MSLHLRPISLREAREFVASHHRHHKPPQGHKFSVACTDEEGRVVGVAIAGRPVARHLDDGATLEVTRLCTDGARNACSMLYAAIRRAAAALGYKRLLTYTLMQESGVSLKATGWTEDGVTQGDSWERRNRFRVDKAPTTPKRRWIRQL